MGSERLPFFLSRSREWWAVADALRAGGAPAGEPALGVWREAAVCHLLFAWGRYDLVGLRLRGVLRDVTGGIPAGSVPEPASAAEARSAAADVFARLRAAVSARYPRAFGRPTAA